MCGITGVLLSSPAMPAAELSGRLGVMTAQLRHRGPDHRAAWTDGVIGLGAARLSVIDPSPTGHQPMADKAGAVHVVCNGEIYNWRDLRGELEQAGRAFRGDSDTEVLVHGYLAWGAKLLDRLRGMFAIAIWDARARRLVLCRDRIGKKPLYYARCEGAFLFGSEIKAILAWPGMKRIPDPEAIHHYLSLQYVPAPWTAFADIRCLSPAHVMTVSAGREPEISRYWSLPAPGESRPRPMGELTAQLASRLEDAVTARLAADVPIGAFLSGGVDSSAVVAMMARHTGRGLKTFCIGFEDPDFDERPFARRIAARYDTDHHELVVRPQAADLLPEIVWHYGQPFADPSAIPTFCLARFAREHVTVVLSGDGGDESFLGYERYFECLNSEWVRRLPPLLRRLAGHLAERLPAAAESHRPLRVLRRLLARLDHRESRRYAPWIAYFQELDKVMGYGDALRGYLSTSSLDLLEPYFRDAPSMVAGAAWADIHGYLPDDLLVKLDVATMAHGLEARAPFLDHELMEWAAAIPASQKIAQGEGKHLLKVALRTLLPPETLARPKQGFGPPIGRWLNESLRSFAREILLSATTRGRGLLRPSYVERLFAEHESGRLDHRTRLWAILMLELWYRTWIDPPESTTIIARPESRGLAITG